MGGQSGSIPQRWRLSAAVGNNIASESISWPGGPLAVGPAYGTNSDGTVFVTATGVSVITPTGRVIANDAFTAVNPGAFAGALRGMAVDAPIVAVLGHIPGNPTNAYRWNYQTGGLQALNMPGGASSIDPGGVGTAMSGDGSILGGTATIGLPSLPYWWDAAGNPHAVPLLAGAVNGSMPAVNFPGSLGGGGMSIPLQGSRAYLYSFSDNQTYNLHAIFQSAGLLPAGWTLTTTQAISDDGSRIFALATAPDGTTRAVLLQGEYFVPGPGAAAVLGLGGLLAARRRRS